MGVEIFAYNEAVLIEITHRYEFSIKYSNVNSWALGLIGLSLLGGCVETTG